MKKYIIINGSPRKDGNSSEISAQLETQFKHAGYAADVFTITEKVIGHCLACDSCKINDVCVQNDDATTLVAALKDCDGAVFIAPIYFGNIPGTSKVLTDRFYSMFNPGKGMNPPDPAKRLGIVFSSGGSPEAALKPANEFVKTCFALAGFGDSKTLYLSGQSQKNSFAENADYQKEVNALSTWLAE